jgi:hypothetical protein
MEEPGLFFERKRSELRVEELPERSGIASRDKMGVIDDEEELARADSERSRAGGGRRNERGGPLARRP